jgi:halimadienyl-diphosphate synthase
MCAGLLKHPGLREALQPQLEQLFKAVGERGLGMSDAFLPDGDDTAAALGILHLADFPVNLKVLDLFKKGDEFVSYQGELQPSITTTSHGAQALWLAGKDVEANRRFIIKNQHPDGRWLVDKWHSSWLYATSQAMLALGFDAAEPLASAVQALLRHQHPDGGWGAGEQSTPVETAFAAISLHAIRQQPYAGEAARSALRKAKDFLVRNYTPLVPHKPLWIGKELYAPFRIDRSFELAALLALFTQP